MSGAGSQAGSSQTARTTAPEMARPLLRSGVRISPLGGAGGSEFLLEDSVASRFYRIGRREQAFIQALDGRTPPGLALQHANAVLDDPLDETDATRILYWLKMQGLLEGSLQDMSLMRRFEWMKYLNWVVFKLPLLNPDRLLDRLLPWLSGLLGWPFFAVWLLVCSAGAYTVAAHWSEFKLSSAGVLYPGNWLWLALVWALIKTAHETFHGLVSKKYGGSVPEAGVILVLFMPMGYVDATSSWRFRDRWERMHTAAAGIYIELFLAGLAALVWHYAAPGMVRDLAFNAVIAGSVTTLLFNANPLMKMDGYFILSDLVNIPNLYQRGQHFVRQQAQRWLLGVDSPGLGGLSPRAEVLVGVYGVSAFVWRILVMIGITAGAYAMFQGAGAFLAGLAMLYWFGPMFWTWWLQWQALRDSLKLERRVYLPRLAAAGVLLLAVLLTPWTPVQSLPAIVDYADAAVVRAVSPGFVHALHVAQDQRVEAGEILITLDNPDLSSDLQRLDIQIASAELQIRRLRQRELLAQMQQEERRLAALREQRAEKQRQVADLEIRAPRAGRVVVRDLQTLPGRYLAVGEEILTVGDPERLEVRAYAEQDLNLDFAELTGRDIRLYLPHLGWRPLPLNVRRVTPRASRQVVDAALTAQGGGGIALKPVTDEGGRPGGMESVIPQFTLEALLPDELPRRIYPGETGRLRVEGETHALGLLWFESVARSMRHLATAPPAAAI
jgi:putative peptide zinc metalloprotease protein